jgi:ankyrin repeat protein
MSGEGDVSGADTLQAVAKGDGRGLAEALEAGADPNGRDRWGVPVLAVAAGRGDLEAVRLLIHHGADPNLASTVGNSALMTAAARGHADVARLLLEAGANPDAANTWGLRAADWSQWAKDPAEMRALLLSSASGSDTG